MLCFNTFRFVYFRHYTLSRSAETHVSVEPDLEHLVRYNGLLPTWCDKLRCKTLCTTSTHNACISLPDVAAQSGDDVLVTTALVSLPIVDTLDGAPREYVSSAEVVRLQFSYSYTVHGSREGIFDLDPSATLVFPESHQSHSLDPDVLSAVDCSSPCDLKPLCTTKRQQNKQQTLYGDTLSPFCHEGSCALHAVHIRRWHFQTKSSGLGSGESCQGLCPKRKQARMVALKQLSCQVALLLHSQCRVGRAAAQAVRAPKYAA